MATHQPPPRTADLVEQWCESDRLFRQARELVREVDRVTDEVLAKVRELYREAPANDADRPEAA